MTSWHWNAFRICSPLWIEDIVISGYPSQQDSNVEISYVFCNYINSHTWLRHEMETFSALLALCAGNSPVTGEFPAQRPVTRSFDVLFDVRLNKRLSKQSWGWWFETQSCSLSRHCNVCYVSIPGESRWYDYQHLTYCPLGYVKAKSCDVTVVFLESHAHTPGLKLARPRKLPLNLIWYVHRCQT